MLPSLPIRRAATLRAAVFAALLLPLLWVLGWYVDQAAVAYPEFDGALNLNVARSVLDGEGYGSFYEHHALFPVETQTNGPYVLPAAVALGVFGLTPFGGQAVNLLYLLVLASLIVWVGRRIGGSWVAGLLAALLALQAPGVRQFALGGFGELPALTWMLGAALVFAAQIERPARWHAFTAGGLLGVSLLTKTVSLIWFPPVIGVLLLWRMHAAGVRAALIDGWRIGAGIVVALLAWELYRLATLGSAAAWGAWWEQQWYEISRQSGVDAGLRDTPVLSDKLRLHFNTLGQFLGLPSPWNAVWLISIAALIALAWRSATAAGRYLLLALAGVAALYLLWWLAITPTEHMWLRRIMLGLLLCQLIAAAAAVAAWRPRRTGGRMAVAVLLLPSLWVMLWNQNIVARPDARDAAQADAELIAAVRQLPADAVLFGSGWWQAPVVALYAQRRIHDEERWTPQRLQQTPGRKFLVLDSYAMNLGAAARERLRWRCDCAPVYLGAGGRIYEIRALRESPAQAVAGSLRIAPDDAIDASGLSASEGGYRWAEQDVTIRLPHGRFSSATLDVRTRELAAYDLPQPPLRLRAMLGACALGEFELQPGAGVVQFDDRCADSGAVDLHLRLNARLRADAIAPDTRPLAWIFGGVELFGAAAGAD